jgi:hypothetical protein
VSSETETKIRDVQFTYPNLSDPRNVKFSKTRGIVAAKQPVSLMT